MMEPMNMNRKERRQQIDKPHINAFTKHYSSGRARAKAVEDAVGRLK